MEKYIKYAQVWSYSFEGHIEYRWLCFSDNNGEDGFLNFQDAVDAAKKMAIQWIPNKTLIL